METNARYVYVALSLILVVALGTCGIIWLKKSRSDKDIEQYVTLFHHNSLGGITSGSSVTMRGIPVGNVRALDFIDNDIEGVRVVLALKKNTPVKIDSQATVQRNLVTGQAMIDLINSTQGAPLLTAAAGEEYPIIQEGEGQVEAIKNRVPEILDHTNELVSRMESVFSSENTERYSQMMANLNEITSELTLSGSRPAEVLSEIRNLAREAKDTAAELRTTTGELRSRLLPVVEGIAKKADLLANDVSNATGSVVSATQTLENPRGLVTGPSTLDLGPGE